MGALIRQHDWAATPLGAIEQWPDGLRTAVGIMLGTRHPAALTWGPELIFLYNDGCASLLGPDKHPRILGLPAANAWPESHHIVVGEIRSVLDGGDSVWEENRMLPICRGGVIEDAWWTYSRSPVHDTRAPNGIGGVLTLITETTKPMRAQRDSEARFLIAREAAQLGIFDYHFESDTCVWDARIRALWGASADEVISDAVFVNGIHPDDRAAVAQALALAADPSSGGEYRAEYRVIHRHSGETRWLMAAGRVLFRDRRPARLVGMVQDVSERRRYEDALRDSEQRLQIGLAAGRLGHWSWNAASDEVTYSDQFATIFGLRPGESLTWEALRDLLHPQDAKLALEAVKHSLASGDDYTIEYRVHRPDGTRAWVAALGRPVYGKGGLPPGLIGVVQDITERKRAEEKIRLLMAEVNHRSKNLLAVVQSIAHQTSAKGSPRAFAHRFGERLQGLAASHDLLVGTAWEGVDLAELVCSQLSHFRDLVRQRIHFEGPDLLLRPAAAQALGMALHELATNAGKYGSLSSGEGEVAIGWSVTGPAGQRSFHMEWRERGGPPVATPIASGFGSKLISHMTEIALQGRARLDYRPEGVVWSIDAPLSRITPSAEEEAPWRQVQES
jgi:PAS domain S-box-containing protein